jgi:hypothetical protein
MKKLVLVGLVVLLAGGMAFAQFELAPSVTVKGDATLTWGIDLDTTANHGFLNAMTSSLSVTLLPKSSATKGSEEDGSVYGYISLSGFQVIMTSGGTDLFVDTATSVVGVDLNGDATTGDTYISAVTTATGVTPFVTAPTVAAYVVLGPVQWLIYSAPDLKVDFAKPIEVDASTDYWAEDIEVDTVLPDFGLYGTGIKFKNDMLTVTGKIASATDWTGAASYGAGLDAQVKVAPITFDAGFVMPFAAGTNIGFGAKVAVSQALGDTGTLTADVAFDGNYTAAMAWELKGGLGLTLTDLMVVTAEVATADSTTGWNLDAEVGVDLKAVADLTLGLDVGLWDIGSADMDWGLAVDAAYKVMMGDTNYVKPGVQAWISDYDAGGVRVALIGTVAAMVIPNTLFTLTFTEKDLTDAVPLEDTLLTFATKISY